VIASANNKKVPVEDPFQDRRNDYDVTNTIKVSSTLKVRRAVCDIFEALYPNISSDPVWLAFYDFERFFYGRSPEYHPVDTTYHDVQHSLDMTLATARLISGYEQTVDVPDRLGPARATLGIVCSLFHDFGYLRHKVRDRDVRHGAQFTRSHVSRSGRFLESYLPSIGLQQFVPVVSKIIHFTGYEVRADDIELDDPRESAVGHLLGTADLLAQMSDRCYLEKCRDRLYPEFVIGDVAVEKIGDRVEVRYRSGADLLAKTLNFYRESAKQRLDHTFNRAYRYLEAYFQDGENPYLHFIEKNLSFLRSVIEAERWQDLRRRPPCEVPDPEAQAKVIEFARERLREVSSSRAEEREPQSASGLT
jgi:hypothetical protein